MAWTTQGSAAEHSLINMNTLVKIRTNDLSKYAEKVSTIKAMCHTNYWKENCSQLVLTMTSLGVAQNKVIMNGNIEMTTDGNERENFQSRSQTM